MGLLSILSLFLGHRLWQAEMQPKLLVNPQAEKFVPKKQTQYIWGCCLYWACFSGTDFGKQKCKQNCLWIHKQKSLCLRNGCCDGCCNPFYIDHYFLSTRSISPAPLLSVSTAMDAATDTAITFSLTTTSCQHKVNKSCTSVVCLDISLYSNGSCYHFYIDHYFLSPKGQ